MDNNWPQGNGQIPVNQVPGAGNMPPQPQPLPNNNYQNPGAFQPGPQGQPMGMPPQPGAPMPAQPMPQAPKPPKQPMNPKTKKKIILFSSLGGVVLVAGVALALILPAVLRVDYGPAYQTAKELKTKVTEIYNDTACDDVKYYVTSYSVSDKTFEGYVEKCKNTGEGADALISKLEASDGVQRNSDIKAQFDAFKKVYDAVVIPTDAKEAALDIYSTWHKYVVAVNSIPTWEATDAQLETTADILIKSNNETFKAYGEGWLEKRKAAADAIRTYNNTAFSSKDWKTVYDAKDSAKAAFNNYSAQNKPDVKSMATVTISEGSKLKTEFDKLYDLIRETYELNYNKDSGDCWEFVGEVMCD